MIFLLDTNVCIQVLRGRNRTLLTHFQKYRPADMAVPAAVVQELHYGAAKSTSPSALADVEVFLQPLPLLPYDADIARLAGQLDWSLASRGIRMGPYDIQIAAMALSHNLIVVTHNLSEFQRVAGLQVVDWEIP